MATVHDASPVTIADILYVVFKYKFHLVAIFLVGVLGALLYLVISQPTYEGVTKILVQLGRERAGALEASASRSNFVFAARPEDLRDEIEILKDRSVAHAVIPALKEWIEKSYRPPESLLDRVRAWVGSAVGMLKELAYEPLYLLGLTPRLTPEQRFSIAVQGALGAEPVEETDVIRLKFSWSNPYFAAHGANLFAQEYVMRRIQIYASSDSELFYAGQIKLYQEKLESIEHQIQTFRKDRSISDLALQRELLLREISQVTRDHENAGITLRDLNVTLEGLRRSYQRKDEWLETPMIGDAIPDLTSLDARYVEVMADRNRLLDTFDPKSRSVQSLNAQMEMLRQQKFQGLENLIRSHMASMTTRRDLIAGTLAGKQKALADLDLSVGTLRDLERQRALIEQDSNEYAKKSEEFRLSDALSKQRITSVRILGPALPPEKPVKPAVTIVMSLAAALSLFLGFAYATISEYFDHTFRDKASVESILGVPMLASVPDTRFSPGATLPARV